MMIRFATIMAILIATALPAVSAPIGDAYPDEIPHPKSQPQPPLNLNPVSDVPLLAVLRLSPPNRLLEISFRDGFLVRGRPVRVSADTLHFRLEDQAANESVAYCLDEILRVRSWQANSSRGAGWGATSGAVVLGGFGALVGMYASALDGDDDAGPVVAFALIGAGLGAAGGGLVGSGVGALISSWQQVWPTGGDLGLPGSPPSSKNARLNLFAGSGSTTLPDLEVSGPVGRISLHKNLNQNVSLGPTIGYHKFGGTEVTHFHGGSEVRSRDDILQVGMDLNLRADRSGISPFATTGAGWYLGNGVFIGGHAGGGLRWAVGEFTDLELDIRYHFSFTAMDDDEVDRFWTAGLNIGFGI